MTCIQEERFVEMADNGGLDAADASERAHFRECAACRESWSLVAATDGLLRESVRPAPRTSWLPTFVAAAAVILAVGFVLLKSTVTIEPSRIPAQEIDASKVAKLIAQLDAESI